MCVLPFANVTDFELAEEDFRLFALLLAGSADADTAHAAQTAIVPIQRMLNQILSAEGGAQPRSRTCYEFTPEAR